MNEKEMKEYFGQFSKEDLVKFLVDAIESEKRLRAELDKATEVVR